MYATNKPTHALAEKVLNTGTSRLQHVHSVRRAIQQKKTCTCCRCLPKMVRGNVHLARQVCTRHEHTSIGSVYKLFTVSADSTQYDSTTVRRYSDFLRAAAHDGDAACQCRMGNAPSRNGMRGSPRSHTLYTCTVCLHCAYHRNRCRGVPLAAESLSSAVHSHQTCPLTPVRVPLPLLPHTSVNLALLPIYAIRAVFGTTAPVRRNTDQAAQAEKQPPPAGELVGRRCGVRALRAAAGTPAHARRVTTHRVRNILCIVGPSPPDDSCHVFPIYLEMP